MGDVLTCKSLSAAPENLQTKEKNICLPHPTYSSSCLLEIILIWGIFRQTQSIILQRTSHPPTLAVSDILLLFHLSFTFFFSGMFFKANLSCITSTINPLSHPTKWTHRLVSCSPIHVHFSCFASELTLALGPVHHHTGRGSCQASESRAAPRAPLPQPPCLLLEAWAVRPVGAPLAG